MAAGRLDGDDHFWNIVSLDGVSYHVDVAGGGREVFLAGDGSLWGTYWWDTSEYPACPEDYAPPEPEPAEEDEPEEEPEDVGAGEEPQASPGPVPSPEPETAARPES